MTTISASEVQRLIATVPNRSIFGRNQLHRPKSLGIITDKQKLVVPSTNDTFRNGIDAGSNLLDIGNVSNVTLDTPFLIWAQPSNMLVGSSIEPSFSTAKIRHAVSTDQIGDDGTESVSLSFYFQWQNPSSNPVSVANVATRPAISGKWAISATSSFVNPYANTTIVFAEAKLRLLEWWNQPPTEPKSNSAQSITLFELGVNGGFTIIDGPGKRASKTVGEGVDLKYPPAVVVPPKGVMVFEVSLGTDIFFGGGGPNNTADIELYDSTSGVLCFFIQFQVTEQVVSKGPPRF
jgi:hypothetical protein